jgi:hypothetical protein
MALGCMYLIFNQIEIVEQPFTGGCNPLRYLNRVSEQIAGVNEGIFILRQPRKQLVGQMCKTQPMCGRQIPAMLFHLAAAEQFRPQWRFGVTDSMHRGPTTESRR